MFRKLLKFAKREAGILIRKGPTYHYAYSQSRLHRWLWYKRLRSVDLNELAFLFHQTNLEIPDLYPVKSALKDNQYETAKAQLLIYFKARREPHFFFRGTEDIAQVVSFVGNNQREATVQAADKICQNVFEFRGEEPIKFKDEIDWTYCPEGNIDWTWDLNRHTFFETLGRAYWYTENSKYAYKFRQLLLDWLAKNPVDKNHPNWTSPFEVALRINIWIWAFYYFRTSPAFDEDTCLAFLKGLLTHGHHLNAYLELHIPNNHLLLEAKALAMVGLLFPEFKQAKHWLNRGLKILYQQIGSQVCSDGVHGERSTFYHRVIASQLLELLLLLKHNKVPIPQRVVKTFEAMMEFELWITKPNGQVPLLGDSTLEDTCLRFSAAKAGPAFLDRNDLRTFASPLDEASVWLLGQRRLKKYLETLVEPTNLNSRAFSEGGYYVMRHGQNSNGAYLVFDCGPFGYQLLPGHGHADALSFELYNNGQTFLVDPGVYSTYLGEKWRNYFRGTRAHNTVVVDEQDQSDLSGIWEVDRPVQSRLHNWWSNDHFDFVDGSHHGYERLSEPITHRRQIFFAKPEYWVVIDVLNGQGCHCFDLYFHLMPHINPILDPEGGLVQIGQEDEPGLLIAPLYGNQLQTTLTFGTEEPIAGWVSTLSGEKQPAPTLRYRKKTVAPVQFCTLLYPTLGGPSPVRIYPLKVETRSLKPYAAETLTSLRIETDCYVDYLMIDRATETIHKVFDNYVTNGYLMYVRHSKADGVPKKIIVRGGDDVRFQGESLFQKPSNANKNFVFDHKT